MSDEFSIGAAELKDGKMIFDIEGWIKGAVGNSNIILPGALDSNIGKTVPVTIDENGVKRTVGEAVMFKDGDGISASVQIYQKKER